MDNRQQTAGYYTHSELAGLGLGSFGDDVLVSRKASLYSPGEICIGNHVRIDDFCLLSGSGGIEIGDYVHLAAFCGLFGVGPVVVGNYANFSARVSVFTSTDDFSGAHMTNPMVPAELTNVTVGQVRIGDHVILGASTIVLPGVEVPDGCAVGAQGLVLSDLEPWGIYVGAPVRLLRARSTALLADEQALHDWETTSL
jgi:dTDP-4-amino-4,6-dideoxy-D-glucose acyltransferase